MTLAEVLSILLILLIPGMFLILVSSLGYIPKISIGSESIGGKNFSLLQMGKSRKIPWLMRALLGTLGIIMTMGWIILMFAFLAPNLPATTSTNAAVTAKPSTNPQVIARFNSSDTENTPSFTVPDSWHLSSAYWGCTGGTGKFTVEEYNTDGSKDPSGITVNEQGTGSLPVATYAYGDSGSHYFSVNSECSWSLAVVVGGS